MTHMGFSNNINKVYIMNRGIYDEKGCCCVVWGLLKRT